MGESGGGGCGGGGGGCGGGGGGGGCGGGTTVFHSGGGHGGGGGGEPVTPACCAILLGCAGFIALMAFTSEFILPVMTSACASIRNECDESMLYQSVSDRVSGTCQDISNFQGTETRLSGSNLGSARGLRACIGECDSDSQCSSGLECFQRSYGEKIPGCSGSGSGGDWDYCYDPTLTWRSTSLNPLFSRL